MALSFQIAGFALYFSIVMARNKNNILLKGASGKIDKLILKHYPYGTVVSKVPDRSKVKLSKKQKQANTRFQEAVKFAKSVAADPALHKPYISRVKKRKSLSIYHAALRDYLQRPAAQNKMK